MESPTTAGLSAREFFSRKIDGARISDAHLATGVAYSTIHSIASGEGWQRDTMSKLVAWSLACPAAQSAGVHISADASLVAPAADAAPAEVA